MKQEYYDIYNSLYEVYMSENDFRFKFRSSDEYFVLKTIRHAIEEADKNYSLRPDAKYFLIVNFFQLIVRPLFSQKSAREFENGLSILEQDIMADIATIVSMTAEEVGRGSISGHQIMRTIDIAWRNLRTTKYELWGG